jgi:hypothetical protein
MVCTDRTGSYYHCCHHSLNFVTVSSAGFVVAVVASDTLPEFWSLMTLSVTIGYEMMGVWILWHDDNFLLLT